MNSAQNVKKIISLLSPQSVALVGASRNQEKIGNKVLRNLILSSYKGEIYPVNKEADEIYNLKAYKSLKEIKSDIDLVWIRLCFRDVIEVVFEAIKKNVKCIVINDKFPNTNEAKLVLKEITDVCLKNNVILIGDGAGGLWSENVNLLCHTSFPEYGNVAFLSQSDALINSFIDLVKSDGIGIKHIIGLGTKAGLKESDFIESYLKDKNLRPKLLCMYLEQVSETQRFELLLKELAKEIPIIILMPRENSSIKDRLFEHTRSKVQDYETLKIYFERLGVHLVNSIMEMTNLVMYYSYSKNVLEQDSFTYVISNSFYLTIEGFSLINKYNLNYIEPDKELTTSLNLFYSNPIKTEVNYLSIIETLFKNTQLSTVILSLTRDENINYEKLAKGIEKLKNTYSKNVIVSILESRSNEHKTLNTYRIANYKYMENAIWSYNKALERTKTIYDNNIITQFQEEYIGVLEENKLNSLKQLFDESKINVNPLLKKSDSRDVLKAFGLTFENEYDLSTKSLTNVLIKINCERVEEIIKLKLDIFVMDKKGFKVLTHIDLFPINMKVLIDKLESDLSTNITKSQLNTLEVEIKRVLILIDKLMNVLTQIDKVQIYLCGDSTMNLVVRDHNISLVV